MYTNLRAMQLCGRSSGPRKAVSGSILDAGEAGRREGTTSAGLRAMARSTAMLLAMLSVTASAQWTLVGHDIDGEAAFDHSGYSVALSADGFRLAVGARENDNANGDNSGHVRVFDWDHATGTWTQLGGDIDGEAAGDASGYSVAMSSDGSRLAVGAPGNDAGGNFAGHVRAFEWDSGSGSWVQLGGDFDGWAAYDNLGCSLALSSDGSRLAIGELGFDGNGQDSGRVRVFEWDGGSAIWVQLGGDLVGEAAGDWAGFHVALSSDGLRVAFGAAENDGNGSQSGHARVFEWDGGVQAWVQLGDDIDGEVQYDRSGIVALSSDGSRLSVGASHNSGAGAYSGHVRVFEWDGGSAIWVQLGDDIDGEGTGDYSGISSALSSDGFRLAVGAIGNDNINGNDAGHVRVYSWRPPGWVRLGDDIDGEAEGDNSGVSVAMSSDGSRLAVGAFYNDNINGHDAGHVRVYSDPIFSDGFESGSTSAWSSTVP